MKTKKLEYIGGNLCRRDGTYYSDFRDQFGKRIRRSLETDKLTVAKHRLLEVMSLASHGELKQGTKRDLTVVEWWEEYASTHLIQLVAKNQKETRRVMLREILPGLGEQTALGQVEMNDIIRLRAKVWGQLKKSTQNRRLAMVKHLFSEARRRQIIEKDPARDVPFLRSPPNPSRTLTNLELKTLRLSCGPKLWVFVMFGVLSGVRAGVLKKIRWRHLERDNSGNLWLKIRTESDLRNKSGRQQNVPIHATLVAALERYRKGAKDDALIFPPNSGVSGYHFEPVWKAARKRAGITGVTFHGLRRTFGTNLARSGVPLTTVQRLMDHASIKQTRAYIDTGESDLLQSISALDGTARALENPADSEKNSKSWAHFGHTAEVDESEAI